MLAALDDCPNVATYNQRRLQDPSLSPIPALWVITDEYNEVFADLVMNGHRQHGPIVPGTYAQAQRQGKGIVVTRRGSNGVLVGFPEPPAVMRPCRQFRRAALGAGFGGCVPMRAARPRIAIAALWIRRRKCG